MIQNSSYDQTYSSSSVSSPPAPEIALVLSSGGVRGIAHIGVLEVLCQAQVPINVIIGCSIGAIIGGMFAACQDYKRVYNMCRELSPKTMYSYRLFGLPNLWGGITGQGFFSTEKIRKQLSDSIQVHRFEDLKIPLRVGATSLSRGILHDFSSGELISPLCASSAIPGFFQPVKIKDDAYVDGAVVNNLPISLAKSSGAKVVIASRVRSKLNNVLNHYQNNSILLSYAILAHHYEKVKEEEVDILISPDVSEFNNFVSSDKRTLQMLYDRGREAAEKQLPNILHLLKKEKERAWIA